MGIQADIKFVADVSGVRFFDLKGSVFWNDICGNVIKIGSCLYNTLYSQFATWTYFGHILGSFDQCLNNSKRGVPVSREKNYNFLKIGSNDLVIIFSKIPVRDLKLKQMVVFNFFSEIEATIIYEEESFWFNFIVLIGE